MKTPIIAIDGPAASGKGTLSKALAKHLDFAHLDTGALYRAVAYTVLERGGDPADHQEAIEAAEFLRDYFASQILEKPELRHDDTGQAASKVASVPKVREALLQLQRNFAQNPPKPCKGAVLDGRDIGTVICPDAPLKLFITAKTEIRAQRRLKELQSKDLQRGGVSVTYEAVLKDMQERDARDAGRKAAPMKPADDAVIIDSSDLTAEQMLEKAIKIANDRLS
ncbi:MAG: (d)CMP kinase [Bdellovibrionales bacterium]